MGRSRAPTLTDVREGNWHEVHCDLVSYNSFATEPQRSPTIQLSTTARLRDSSSPFPNPETTIAMDPQPPHPNEAPTDGVSASPTTVTANGRPNSTGRRLDHPLQAIMGAVVVLLLGFALTQTNDRISRLEDKVDASFARIDERFTAQDVRLNEINLKLTALIAALNAAAESEAALEGRLLDPNTSPADEPAN